MFGPFGPDFLEPYKNNFYSLDTFTRNLRACQGESSRYYRSLFHLFAEHKWCGFLPRASPRWCSCGFFGRKNGVNRGATIAETCPNVCGEKVALICLYKVALNNSFLLSVGRTPMMDLLVQITSAHRINPGGHVIQVMNDRSDDFLYYKPSTPIGKNF